MKTAELELALKPNVGWTVSIIRDGRNEGPTHTGYFNAKGDARREAERAVARMAKRGVKATILAEHRTISSR